MRAIRGDKDRGEAYTNRIMTAGLIGLGLITLLLTLAVPAIIWLYSAAGWKDRQSWPAQYESMILLAYYCMPQVFFYGVHVLAGQVLNARDRFGPMMWAPIANNVVSIMVLLLLPDHLRPDRAPAAPFTPGQELLLGIGSTLGIAAQAAVLVPFLRLAATTSGRASTSSTPGWARRSGWPSGRSASCWSPRPHWSSSASWPAARPWEARAPASPRTATRTRCGSCRTR